MHTSDSPFVADWFVVSLRWLILLGLTISLALGNQLLALPNLLLLLLTLWNSVLTVLAGLNKRMARHREISLAVDIIITALFFWYHGGFASPGFWIVALPILSATFYFELWGGLIAALLMAVLELGVSFTLTLSQRVSGIAVTAGTILFGLIFGYLGREMMRHLRRLRHAQLEEQERIQKFENERLRAIYNMTSTLTATLNYQKVLESALDLSLKALNTDPEADADSHLVSAVLLFADDELIVGTARRFTPADLRVSVPGREGILARAINEGEVIIGGSTADDPELSRFVSLRTCQSIYCFPMRSGFSVYGVLIFSHPQPNYFARDRREVLDILGRQAVIAIQNARLYQDLVEEKERMIEVQEEARKKLARDLHDGPTQSVAAMAMRVNLAKRMVERDPQAAVSELGKIEDLARRTTKEIRHMLFTLRPLVLESQGLVPALQAMAEKMKETYGQEVIIKVDESTLEQMEMGKMGVVFYIAEEAVNNARKHAQAPHIWVRLRPLEKDQEIVLLEIADDGVGFDVEMVNRAYDKRGSLGMVNLRERTELVNGLLHIDSAPGKGTKVQVFIPLSEDAGDRLHHAR
jgi:signal transduction histidine kinase